jgi:ATP-dependent protease ClpP protease subunit
MKKILGIVVLVFFLYGCSSTQTTRNIEINQLKIKEIINSSSCKTGTHYSLYLDGVINEDSSFAIERILSQQTTKCINDKGIHIVPSVYLNSRGGYLRDGYKLGETFTKYQVVTRINSGAVCMSACSTAFLGGLFRQMYGSAKLMVHAPYRYISRNTIECTSASASEDLKKYYVKKIGTSNGELLFDRTMKYCGKTEGWFLNKDAAKLFNITTD